MADQPIPNDDLGDWGESQFRTLCAASRIVANKAERDKMGWDFIVELPPEAANAALPLDQRPNSLGCRVQIKTHWEREDDRFEMTLSAAQRLAWDPGPSFVLVLTAKASAGDEDPKLVDCHLIHMLDKNLERVLARLRECAADPKSKPLNEQKITYSPKSAGEKLPPKGNAIREALIRSCGADPQAYIAKKGDQLKNLGYKTSRYQLKTTITANNPDEFVDMMLGLRPLSAENLATYDTRFGVLLPVEQIPEGATYELQYTPPRLSHCTIRVRSSGLRPPAVFQGEIILPGIKVPDQFMRTLVKASFFTLELRPTGKIDFKLDRQSLFKAKLILEDWGHYLRLLELLGEGELKIDVEADAPSVPLLSVALKQTTPLLHEPWLATLADIARRGEALLKLAGAKGESTTINDLEEAAEMIFSAHMCLCDPEGAPPRAFQSSGQLPDGVGVTDVEFLHADWVVIAGVALAYACRVTMRAEAVGDGVLWRQVDAKPEALNVFDGTEEKYTAFVAETKERAGLQSTMVRRFGVDSDGS